MESKRDHHTGKVDKGLENMMVHIIESKEFSKIVEKMVIETVGTQSLASQTPVSSLPRDFPP